MIGLVALLVLGFFAASLTVEGQQAQKLHRIGYMSVRAGPTEPNEPLDGDIVTQLTSLVADQLTVTVPKLAKE